MSHYKKLKQYLFSSHWFPTFTIWFVGLVCVIIMYFGSGKVIKMVGETEPLIDRIREVREKIILVQLPHSFHEKNTISEIPDEVRTFLQDTIDELVLVIVDMNEKSFSSSNFNSFPVIDKTTELLDILKSIIEVERNGAKIQIEIHKGHYQKLENAKLICEDIVRVLDNKQQGDFNNFRNFRVTILIIIALVLLSIGIVLLYYNRTKIADYNKIQNTVSQLKEQKIHLENLIESTPTAIAVVDNNDVIRRINPKFTKLFGYSEKEAVGENLTELIIPKEYINEGRSLSSEESLQKGRAEKETKRKHKNGSIVDVFVIGSAIMVDEKFEGIYAIYQDISERKKNENELLKSKEVAENADKLKSVFLAQMSHEIRTPINAMVSLASLLKDDLADTLEEDHALSIELINKAGNRIVRTVDLLLNLSELQTGTYKPIIQKFDVFSDVLSKLIVDYKSLSKEKGLELSIKVNTNNAALTADLYTVNQIFTQLIDNSLKYTEEGKISVSVFRNRNDQLIVEVSDTGIGINKDYLANLFTPFSQEEMGYSRKYEGNGIGLSLVKNYCELNKAIIEVKSIKDQGSDFRVVFNNG